MSLVSPLRTGVADAPFVSLSSAWLGDAPGRFAPENYQTAGSGVKEMGRARRAPWGDELHFLLPGLGLLGFSRGAHRLSSRASSRKARRQALEHTTSFPSLTRRCYCLPLRGGENPATGVKMHRHRRGARLQNPYPSVKIPILRPQ